MILEKKKKNLERKYLRRIRDVKIKKKTIRKRKPNPRSWFFSKLNILYNAYKKNPWIVPRKSLFLQFYGKEVKGVTNDLALGTKEYASGKDLNLSLSRFFGKTNDETLVNRTQKDIKAERDFLLDKYLGFYLNCDTDFQESMMNNINFYCLLFRLKKMKKFFIKSIKQGDLDIESMILVNNPTDFATTECRDNTELFDKLTFVIEPVRVSRKNLEQFFIYQTISLPLIHKSRRDILKRNSNKSRVDQKIRKNKDKNHYDLLVPENLFSTRRRRELRILISLNSRKALHRKRKNYNENKINNFSQVLAKNNDFDSETKKLMNLKLFLWPNYRLEDLACMNRYWFDTHNGSRFSLLRIRMYPRLKI